MPKRIFSGILVSLLLIGILTLAFNIRPVRAATPSINVINPGSDGYPSRWNASTARGLGTSNFRFYNNETAVGSTFFVNVTINGVTLMRLWGIGLIYDNTTLAYVSAWMPTDHVFSATEADGTSMIAPAVVVSDYDATHQEVLWGCGYIMPDPPWTFNGTGVLCQIQFKIIGEVSPARPQVNSILEFDPSWTAVYYYPAGNEIPLFFQGSFVYDQLQPSIQIANPGPGSRPSMWNASSTNRGFNTSNFTFYSNETTVGSTFFINVTISSVTNLKAWGFGLIYDNTALQFLSAWRPTNHVFSPLEAQGVSMVSYTAYANPVDASHNAVEWACTYIMPYPPWTFNGSGVLCQIQFKIIGKINSTRPQVSSLFMFEPDGWTAVYYHPSGYETPTLGTGSFLYNPAWVAKGPGDLNHDGRVNMEDVGIGLDAFGSYPTHPRWNPWADTNSDGRIDMEDIIIVLTNFGQHYQ